MLTSEESGIEWCMSQDRFLTRTAKLFHVLSSVLQPLLACVDFRGCRGDLEHAWTSLAAIQWFSACLNRKTLLI